MKEFINKVSITGVLVKMGLEEKTSDKGDYIAGGLIIRTADGSEHEVELFANKYKKDANGNFTTDENKLYKSYVTIINDYKSIENNPDNPDIISVTNGSFSVNDYKSPKDGEVKTYNRLNTKFVNRLEPKDIENTPQTATFEVEGIIKTIKDEIIKDVPTGNLRVELNTMSFTTEGKGKDAKSTPSALIPINLTVPKSMADAFKSAGYYEGCVVKLNGKIINTKETETIVEKQAFGEDLHKVVTKTTRMYEVASGSNPVTIYDVELTDDIISQLISKRKLKLEEVKSGKATTTVPSGADEVPFTPTTSANPFANPFAQAN